MEFNLIFEMNLELSVVLMHKETFGLFFYYDTIRFVFPDFRI